MSTSGQKRNVSATSVLEVAKMTGGECVYIAAALILKLAVWLLRVLRMQLTSAGHLTSLSQSRNSTSAEREKVPEFELGASGPPGIFNTFPNCGAFGSRAAVRGIRRGN